MNPLIDIAWEWGERCFGLDHMRNYKIRSLRFTEEAVELGQALGVPEHVLHKLVSEVYARPPGQPYQEIGGSMVTLMCLCRTLSIDPEWAFSLEVRRVLAKDPEHFRRRNQVKIDAGLEA